MSITHTEAAKANMEVMTTVDIKMEDSSIVVDESIVEGGVATGLPILGVLYRPCLCTS